MFAVMISIFLCNYALAVFCIHHFTVVLVCVCVCVYEYCFTFLTQYLNLVVVIPFRSIKSSVDLFQIYGWTLVFSKVLRWIEVQLPSLALYL